MSGTPQLNSLRIQRGKLPIGVIKRSFYLNLPETVIVGYNGCIRQGNVTVVEAVKRQMRSFAIGRCVRKEAEGFELRESHSPYKAFFNTEKNDIEGKNL